jgi:amino acid transporter
MEWSRLKRRLIGDPLSTDMMAHERIPKWKALAVLSSDALSSVAYATEEILIPLTFFGATLGAAGISTILWSLPIGMAIVALLFIITISYQQTISAYPQGGGAYTVAKENLGPNAGLVAGASLLIDYVLTVSVSVAAGVENVCSAFPNLTPHKVLLDVGVIVIITLFNLRGVRESASVFALPTYFFIFSFIIMFATGAFRAMNGDIPVAVPIMHETLPAVPFFLLLRAFSSGCSALTGVEAISNGIPVFKDPAQRNAKLTMIWMSIILGSFFIGMTVFAHLFSIVPSESETVVSLLSRKIFGDSFMYYTVQVATALILLLAANTSYADFPRLASLMARDRFLPRQLASLGDRLVFSNGILGLSLNAILMIVLFGGETHHLIPLYAVGVFLSFTLSQSGMVMHHWRLRELHWKKALLINATGAFTTLTVLLVLTTTKFMAGAWMIVLAIPLFVLFFLQIHKHYKVAARQLTYASEKPIDWKIPDKHLAIIPISGVHVGVIKAVKYGKSIATDVRACTVDLDSTLTENLQKAWRDKIPDVPLVVLRSPFRSVFQPLIAFIEEEKQTNPDQFITVIIPEFITKRWYHQFLHNQTALFLYAYLRRKRGVVVTSVRYHLR